MDDYEDPDECTNGGYLPAVKMFDIMIRKEEEFIPFICKMDLGEVRKKFHDADGDPISDDWEEFLDPENPPEDLLLGQSAWNSLTNEERNHFKSIFFEVWGEFFAPYEAAEKKKFMDKRAAALGDQNQL